MLKVTIKNTSLAEKVRAVAEQFGLDASAFATGLLYAVMLPESSDELPEHLAKAAS